MEISGNKNSYRKEEKCRSVKRVVWLCGPKALSPGLDNSTGNSTVTRQLLESYLIAT